MSNLLNGSHFRDNMSSPSFNNRETSLEAEESESEADNEPEPEAGDESEGILIEKSKARIDLTHMDNCVDVVNENLSNCK